MQKNTELQFTKGELQRLLNELDHLDDGPIVPLSSEEVAALEAAYDHRSLDPLRDARQREEFEQMRREWLANVETISGLLVQMRSIGLSQSEFVERMRIDQSILLKLERRLLTDIPQLVIEKLAEVLQVSLRSVYLYLTRPPKGFEQMAASSKGKPGGSQTENWAEAIANSNMTREDKAYWLNLKR